MNYTLRGPSQKAVAEALAGRAAIVTPAVDGCVIIFDAQSDNQDTEVIADLAAHLSHNCACIVWAVLNHDDDILWYQLFLSGELADEYDSSPGYFDELDLSLGYVKVPEPFPPEPRGGDATKLCSAFGTTNVAEVERVLRTSGISGYVFAFERHKDLVRLLRVPAYGLGSSYHSVAGGEMPDGLEEGDLLRIPG